MIAASILAICGLAYSPAPSWDEIPLPPGARIVEIPFSDIDAKCGYRSGATTTVLAPSTGGFGGTGTVARHIEYGCAMPEQNTAYVPSWKTWPGTRECWKETLRHEGAHLKGYRHP